MFGGLFRDKVKLILYEQIVQKLEHNLNSLTYEKKTNSASNNIIECFYNRS